MAFRAEESLGYWLFYTHRGVAHAFAEALRQTCLEHDKAYAVTPPQLGVLSALYETDGLTIGAIGRKRGADAPTVTGIVNRLEHSGLVERLHDREDRRVVKVYLTDEGRSIEEFLSDAAIEFHNIMTRDFSEDEKRTLLIQLQRLVANASGVSPGTGDRFGLLPQNFQCEEQTEG